MFTKAQLADLLMDFVPIRKGENESFYTVFPPDEKCPFSVVASFFYEKDRIVFIANAPDMKLEPYDVAAAIAFCNKNNKDSVNAVSYYYGDANELRMSGCLFTDIDVPDEYVKVNFIAFYIRSALKFFAEAGKKFSLAAD